MKKHIITLLLVATLCASCSERIAIPSKPRLAFADFADAGTTAYGLAQGLRETNGLLGWAGRWTPVVALAVKFGGKALLGKVIPQTQANLVIEEASAGAACANVATILSAAPPVAMLAGISCGVIYFVSHKPE